jgi:MYXO-CTERM domain-containing protein
VAQADGSMVWDRYCSTGTFKTCFSVKLNVLTTEVAPGVFETWATLDVLNLAGQYGSPADMAIYKISLTNNVPTTGFYAATGAAYRETTGGSQGTPEEWKTNNVGGLSVLDPTNGTTDDRIGGSCSAFGATDVLWCGGTISIKFKLGGPNAATWDPASGGTTVLTVYARTPGGQGARATITPEPITLTLIGTGLLGLGGAAVRRRRKGLDVSSD